MEFRFFITSSQLSTTYMSLYAKKTNNGQKDILVIDNYYKKKALLDLIHEAAEIHSWHNILDFSIPIDNQTNLKPTRIKSIIRNIKTQPLISWIYNFILNLYTKQEVLKQKQSVLHKLQERFLDVGQTKVELYLLTQTAINNAFLSIFSNASVYFMEHGLGDYLLAPKQKKIDGFIGFFSKEYKNYLQRRNKNIPVYELITKQEFQTAFGSKNNDTQVSLFEKINQDKPWIFFLMDAAECYNPPAHFWTDYIQRCIDEVSNPEDYLFILKPHPRQSNEVIAITKQYFQENGLDYVMLDNPVLVSLSAEYIYIHHQDNIKYVFSTFSSALFYLAHFYGEKAKFYHLYDFVGPYFKDSPKQFLDIYGGLKPLIHEVFSNKYCLSLR